jgi:integrase
MRGIKQKVQNRKPFTIEEIQLLLETVKADEYVFVYYDFCCALIRLGLRPSECIGLRWKHIDLQRKEITICESLSRSGSGETGGYARERKETKTGNTRVLPLSESLVTMFAGRRPINANPDDLVFTTSEGKTIDDHNFRERVWKPICKKAGVEYRPPYACRHSFTSHGLEQGISVVSMSHMLGHTNARMVTDTYGHIINRPQLPDL